MAKAILNAAEIQQLEDEIAEATALVETAIQLHRIDEAPTTQSSASYQLLLKAGWLLDRCTANLGGIGMRGADWLEWSGARRGFKLTDDAAA